MNNKGLEPYVVNALAARGVTAEQQSEKMRNLARLSVGGVVITKLAHDRYVIAGLDGTYNPYTNTWVE